MHIRAHQLKTAEQLPSPNCDKRPDPDDISLLVIHCISLPPEQFGGDYIDQLFCNRLNPDDHPYFREIYQLKVSAHVLVRRDGSLAQYVPFNMRAWHAGISSFDGRERCNDFSIGIELEGSTNQTYSLRQYRSLVELTGILLETYPNLRPENIVGHSDIAPGRKSDPGPGFDWQMFRSMLNDSMLQRCAI